MKIRRLHISKQMSLIIVLAVMAVSIGFTERKQSNRLIGEVTITIDHDGHAFLDKKDVMRLATGNEENRLPGLFITTVDLKRIEKSIEENPFVRNAEVSRDLKGNLTLVVSLHRPIARIFDRAEQDRYISQTGDYLPESQLFTARVRLIEMEDQNLIGTRRIEETKYGEQLFELLKFIYEDEFWNAQTASMEIDKRGEIIMYPQVTKQIIEFGTPEDYERKFRKLSIFYKKILPGKGWNAYSRVSVKYKDQIIAE